MQLKPYTHQHYETLLSWWKQYSWIGCPPEALPPTGYIAFKDEHPIAAGFVYMSDTSMAFMDWIIADKFSNKEDRKYSLALIINELISVAKANGKTFIYTCTANPSLIETYKKHGLIPMEQGVTTMVLPIGKADPSFLG